MANEEQEHVLRAMLGKPSVLWELWGDPEPIWAEEDCFGCEIKEEQVVIRWRTQSVGGSQQQHRQKQRCC